MLYLQAPAANKAAMVFALATYVLVHWMGGKPEAVFWLVALILGALVRLWLWGQHALAPQLRDDQSWLNAYTLAGGIVGLSWACAFITAPHTLSTEQIIAMIMLYFGISMAGNLVLSMHLPALLLYTAPPAVGLSYWLYQQPAPTYQFLMVGLWFFYLAVWHFGRNLHERLINSLNVEAHNQELLEDQVREIYYRDRLVARQTEQLRRTNKALQQSGEQLEYVLAGANLGFWDWNYQTGEQEVNERWLDMLGLSREDISHNIKDWTDRLHPDDREHLMELIQDSIARRVSYVGDFRILHKDGHWVWIQGSGGVVEYDPEGRPLRLCGIYQEITDRKAMERQLEYQATHDALTGLLNRRELLERLENELNRANRYAKNLVVFLLDIDHFKQINDNLGHKAGDRVLQGFADLLNDQLRKMDLCGRYGGEEFIIVLPETKIDQAVGMGERLRSLVEGNEQLAPGLELSITVSIGIADYPASGDTAAELIEAADKALYRAKNQGRNRIATASNGSSR